MKVMVFCIMTNVIAAIALFGAGGLEINNLGTSIPALLCLVAAICGIGKIRKENK